ncbi:type II secretion system protein GspG [Planctomycetes bacterium K23_9]|uniref:Type II secretion system protein G n=1 Tax=Stieleria marina TaxID=1930275 RepID=A0A517NQF4_9BACT|nr:Putative type II secretion system protein G precursor [Planctomycetes bacterium K23_9]
MRYTQNARRSFSRQSSSRTRRGFTLLELLLVLAILVVLGGIVGGNMLGAKKSADADATRVQMDQLKTTLQMYQLKMNGLPETLEMLRDGPSDAAKKAKWIDPMMKDIPNDAWGNAFVYAVNGNGFELRSGGIDGQVNTDDDIIVTD